MHNWNTRRRRKRKLSEEIFEVAMAAYVPKLMTHNRSRNLRTPSRRNTKHAPLDILYSNCSKSKMEKIMNEEGAGEVTFCLYSEFLLRNHKGRRAQSDIILKEKISTNLEVYILQNDPLKMKEK